MGGDALGPSGRRLFTAVSAECELDEHERVLLMRACQTVDTIAALDAILAEQGLVLQSSDGARTHPALRERRAEELKLVRLMKILKLQFGEAPPGRPAPRPRVIGGIA